MSEPTAAWHRRILGLVLGVAIVGWGAFLLERVRTAGLYEHIIDGEVERGTAIIHIRNAQHVAGMVRGRVLSVNTTIGGFMANLGKNDLVAPGTRLVLRRDDRLVGFAVVDKVDDGWLFAHMLEDRMRLSVQVDDVVGLDLGLASR